MSENTINAEIKKIKDILTGTLTIPDYQRPYRWKENNVRQLLVDISNSWKSGKKSYRVGSVILHQEKENESEKLNIVDGQQRITTVLLLLKVLISNLGKDLLTNLQYKHSDSAFNIKTNYKFIEDWTKSNIAESDKPIFLTYITDYCEFVEIVVTDLSEAFQMFDSQNGRGKELEAYNLLKAYHIRAMEFDSQETKIECDKRWESATRFTKDTNDKNHQDLLRQIFDEQLYRTRVWSKKEDAYSFNKKKIDEFKGFIINQNKIYDYPFLNSQLLQFIAKKYMDSNGLNLKNLKKRFNNVDILNIDPFVLINQKIINGKDFFDYIETYIEIYKQLFVNENEQLKDFKKFYNEYSRNYSGSHRPGDTYLRELYKSLIFLMFDKFGEDGVNKFHKVLYALVYRLRLEKMQVKYDAVAKYPKNYFSIIEQANSYLELQKLEKKAKIEVIVNFKNAIKVKEFFTSNNYKIKEA